MTFNFEYWAQLSQKNPEKFQEEKKQFLYSWIDANCAEHNKASLKLLVDNLCVKCAGSNEQAAASAFNLMMESLDSLKENLIKLQRALNNKEDQPLEDSFFKYRAKSIKKS